MALATLTASTDSARQALYRKYRSLIQVNGDLSRSLVSFQSNRERAYYRWFKYKEGFSASLVEYVLTHIPLGRGTLLDPFVGSGASLFAARELGWDAQGIELLPVGVRAVEARLAAEKVNAADFKAAVNGFMSGEWRHAASSEDAFPHLRITQDAFPPKTERDLVSFRAYLRAKDMPPDVRMLLDSACLSVLESISYTRKDGQYLRWDSRSPRSLKGKPFHKGEVSSFDKAMRKQLDMMLEDMSGGDLFSALSPQQRGEVSIVQGSCLRLLPGMGPASFDLVITSPPYCNRYDYTRTYALELAYLGVDEAQLKQLRQDLLSCTVENRPKTAELRQHYGRCGSLRLLEEAMAAFDNQEGLQEVLDILDAKGQEGVLNNPNVPRMVRNYFLESSVVIFELSSVLRPGGRVVMVNDNVQYAGEEVPVDLILCDIAAEAGLRTEAIWTLGRGKGNSSQQMGEHGRNELRKCAYVWRKND